ncbi:MAG: MFS transporter [Chloroflexi bacterium]|nr:MFS transporter [Chloroflexota bacterium]
MIPSAPASPDPAAHRQSDSLWSPGRRPLTLGLIFRITLVAAEALAVSTVMPLVARDLNGLELYGWVFSAFFLGSLIGISVVGGLIDERGIVFPFLAGLVLFGIGLLIAGLAPNMLTIVVGRFIQGLGGGAVPPVAYVAIGRSLPDRLRPQMFAMLSAAWVLPGILGPAIAGFVAETWHWRAVFLGLLPLILLAGSMALRAMRRIPDAPPAADGSTDGSPAERAGRRRRYGWAVLVSIGAGVLTTGLLSADLALLLAVAGAGLAITLVAFHRLTPPGTFRLAPGYPSAVLLRGFLTFAFFSIDAYVALLLVEVRGWSAAAAGLALTGATISWSFGSWLQSRTVGRIGAERFVRIGFPVVALGVAGTALALVPAIPAWIAIPWFALSGLGMGLAYSQFAIIVLRDAPRDNQGAITAAISLSDALGTALGTGIAGAMVAASVRLGAGPAPGLGFAIAMGVAVAIFGFLLAPRLRHPPAVIDAVPA